MAEARHEPGEAVGDVHASPALQVLLQVYADVHAEIRIRAQQLATLDQIFFAAVVAALGFAFANVDDRWGLFLVIPYVSAIFYAYGQDAYHNQSLLRCHLIKNVLPPLRQLVAPSDAVDVEDYVHENYAWWNSPRFLLVEWGIFVGPPALALWRVFDHLSGPTAWLAWAFGCVAAASVAVAAAITVFEIPVHRYLPVPAQRRVLLPDPAVAVGGSAHGLQFLEDVKLPRKHPYATSSHRPRGWPARAGSTTIRNGTRAGRRLSRAPEQHPRPELSCRVAGRPQASAHDDLAGPTRERHGDGRRSAQSVDDNHRAAAIVLGLSRQKGYVYAHGRSLRARGLWVERRGTERAPIGAPCASLLRFGLSPACACRSRPDRGSR